VRAATGPGSTVVVTIDSTSGTRPISPWIYGLNDAASAKSWGAHPTRRFITMTRLGGNRWSAYNWETNWSNAGADYGPYHNDQLLSSSATPGDAVKKSVDPIFGRTNTLGNAALVTVPLLGFVSGPWIGNAPVPAAADVTAPAVPALTGARRFLTSLPHRPGDPRHARATASPDVTDAYVYQDDFLTWLDHAYPGHRTNLREPIFIGLDGEPDGWGRTHAEVRGGVHPSGPDDKGTWTFSKVQVGFEELVEKSAAAARAVKSVLGTGALVFGPVMGGWAGFINLDHAKPPPGYTYYLEYYLDRMKEAEGPAGTRLLDVLDVHLYPEATNGGSWSIANEYAPQTTEQITVREQAPRTFWDPTYNEQSWITKYGVVPPCNFGCTPQMIPRLKRMIAAHYPGTKLAISEYALYRAGDMSGGIAQADMLGIFAREGVYQASAWPNTSEWAPGYGTPEDAYRCLWAAFSAYLNYDGAGGHFGDTYIPATTVDPSRPVDELVSGRGRSDGSRYPTQHLERLAVHASFDRANPRRAVIVAINKSLTDTLDVVLKVKHEATFTTAEVYRIDRGADFGQRGWSPMAATCTGPTRQADVKLTAGNAFTPSLPPQTITVLVLKP